MRLLLEHDWLLTQFTLLSAIITLSKLFLCGASIALNNDQKTSDFQGLPDNQMLTRHKRANIDCGESFTPCNRRPVGFINPFSFDDSSDQLIPSASDGTQPSVSPPQIRLQMVQLAIQEAKDEVDLLFNRTETLIAQNGLANQLSRTDQLWSTYFKSFQYSKDMSYSALISIGSSQRLKSFGLSTYDIIYGLPRTDLKETGLADICPLNPIEDCVPGKFRMYHGTCNNVQNSLWGSSFEPLQRFLAPSYADEVSRPRAAADGDALPNVREISINIFEPRDKEHKHCSLILAHWAQFLYSDMVQLGSIKGVGLSALPCCETSISHPECLPVNVSVNDPVFKGEVTCMNYARISVAPRENCLLGPREQINMATSYIDGSMIYGSTLKISDDLRSRRDGLLKSSSVPFLKELLSSAPYDANECRSQRNQPCFLSGSERVNWLPTVTALHTVWMRQHNRLAKQLKDLNPHWDDERLYQEARRIVGAQIQFITYKEFLPLIIGRDNMQKYQLSLQRDGYYSDYSLRINPSVLDVFASTVGLFFYSLFPKMLGTLNKANKTGEEKPLNAFYYDPGALYFQDGVDGFLRYLLSKTIQDADVYFPDELSSKFLQEPGQPYGLDLPALTVHMGRDIGIPSYAEWRAQCGLGRPQNWNDLLDDVKDALVVDKLKRLYKSVEDVDLFVMGLAEKAQPGSLLGPTFSCIFGMQFQRSKRGDRFWHENFFFPSAFTDEQLMQIRKTSLARIICDNTDDVGKVQPYPMLTPDSFENCPIECNGTIIPEMDIRPWIDAEPKVHLPITQDTLQKALKLGVEHATDIDKQEGLRVDSNQDLGRISLNLDAVSAHANLLSAQPESLDRARVAKILLEATKVLVRGDGLQKDEQLPTKLDIPTLQRLLPQIDVSQIIGNVTANKESCVQKQFPCDHTSAYRTISGWCNNLKFPSYGNAFNAFRRLLDPTYADGFDEPRSLGADGRLLPSARAISNAVHKTIHQRPHVKYTHMLMQFGQFLDHDFTHSPVSHGVNDSVLNCSRCDSKETVSINCLPIVVPSNDPFFPPALDDGSPRCLAFTRSLLGQLTLGYREQIDQLTSFIDASTIYGSTDCQNQQLRLFAQGKLNYTEQYEGLRQGLPQGNQEKDCRSTPKHMCFMAGDGRNNEQTALAAMHTIWLREHNRIATRLNRINNFWTDEKIFQETRRIVIAEMQHITFNEFLPKVLGMEVMEKYDLILKKDGYYSGYDPICDATVSNEFATAAFRFGHTLIRSTFNRMDDFYQNFSAPLQLRSMFMNSTPIYDGSSGSIDTIVIGLLGVNAEDYDAQITEVGQRGSQLCAAHGYMIQSIVEDVRDHLFEKKDVPHSGLDLPSLNIQRSRDHALQPYNRYRQLCGLPRARTFDDLVDVMSKESIDALRNVYRSVDDIDLFPGAMSERSTPGGLVGHTVACIIGEQMQRARKCDRFWYENDYPGVRFTPDQLMEIRKASLAKVVCANTQFIRKIQPNVFDMPDELLNNQVPCQDIPEIDLYEWLDRQFCVVDHRVINLGQTKRITPCVSCTCTAEGPNCNSVRISNCKELIEQFLFSEVTEDTVCVIQCSAYIKRKALGAAVDNF